MAPNRTLLCIKSQIRSAASQSFLFNDPVDSQKVNRCISVFSACSLLGIQIAAPRGIQQLWRPQCGVRISLDSCIIFPHHTWIFTLQRDVAVHYNSRDLCSLCAALLSSPLLSPSTSISGHTLGHQTVF